MAIAVIASYPYVVQTYQGVPIRKAKLSITGLTVAAPNVVPHGLPSAPITIAYDPSAAGGWGETQAPDATNLYITVGTGGATSGAVFVEY